MRWNQQAGGMLACALIGAAACGSQAAGDGPDANGPDGGACATPAVADPHASERLACAYAAGARASATLGLDDAARAALPIQHVIVVMKENRSFDHIFGALGAMQPDAETFPAAFTNPDPHGNAVAPYHLHTTCVPYDLGHQWQAMHDQVDGGKMDGFAKVAGAFTGTDGWFALGYYDEHDLPF